MFPPRNEPYDFRVQLESKYRDGLRRSPVSSYVDIEGDIVWVQEYLRYRLNACQHPDAVDRVLSQVQTGRIAPVCGAGSSGAVAFPPRNEPFDFRQRLETLYRDTLRRAASTTYVDIEGDIVWVQEYLRYRVNGCDHTEAAQRVFLQIDGRGVQPVCVVPTTTTTSAPITTTVRPAATLRADPGGPYGPVNSGSPVTFSGLRSTSTPYPIAHYNWDCGQAGNANCRVDSPTPTFRYNKEPASVGSTRTYTVTLTIEDTEGNRASATTTVRVTQVY
jgi:hypothetical protein